MSKDKKKRKSIRSLMKFLNLKQKVNWDFIDATTRDFSTWKKALKKDFEFRVVKNNFYPYFTLDFPNHFCSFFLIHKGNRSDSLMNHQK